MSMSTNASDIKKGGFYTKGLGWSENEPLVTQDENGQRVVQTSGLQRQGRLTKDGGLYQGVGDRLAKAYDNLRPELKGILKRWRSGEQSVGNGGDTMKNALYRQYKSLGIYKGNYAGFDRWLDRYMSEMSGETMNVQALMNSRGMPTDMRDRRDMQYVTRAAQAAKNRLGEL